MTCAYSSSVSRAVPWPARAIIVPKVTAEDWRLRIHGMVDREMQLNFSQLVSRPLIERDVTLTCVSNEIGGHLVGNARWIGAPLAAILREAGVRPGATQLVSRSVDGFTIGTPTARSVIRSTKTGKSRMPQVGATP